ncbi:unnamed protein product [Mytilus coruscus]|uniref:Uncharacterized protein n=1 Tax=Mytilus coruscus TaxID=42192 RepID=A0A6J8BMR9_MYTCO|nr:unnamed protein product [Mytilus coruscus]
MLRYFEYIQLTSDIPNPSATDNRASDIPYSSANDIPKYIHRQLTTMLVIFWIHRQLTTMLVIFRIHRQLTTMLVIFRIHRQLTTMLVIFRIHRQLTTMLAMKDPSVFNRQLTIHQSLTNACDIPDSSAIPFGIHQTTDNHASDIPDSSATDNHAIIVNPYRQPC